MSTKGSTCDAFEKVVGNEPSEPKMSPLDVGATTKVLVADDEPDIRQLLRSAFELDGYEVVEAADGREAVDLAFQEIPDLIVLDVMMPRLDGFQALAVIRQHRLTRLTPVIMLTARGSEFDRVSGLSLGANDYVAKPFSLEELRLRADKQLQVVAQMRRLERATAADPISELGNRRAFGKAYDKWWNDFEVESKPFSLVYIWAEGLETGIRSQALFTADALLRRVGTALRSSLDPEEEAFDMGAFRYVVCTSKVARPLLAREIHSCHAVERALRASSCGHESHVRSISATATSADTKESFLEKALGLRSAAGNTGSKRSLERATYSLGALPDTYTV